MAQRERPLADRIIAYVNARPFSLADKRAGGPHNAGHPDVSGVFCLGLFADGTPFSVRLEVEVKRPGQKPRKRQRILIGRWQDVGALSCSADCFADFLAAARVFVRRAAASGICSLPEDPLLRH